MAPHMPLCCSSRGFDLLKRQLPILNSPDALLQGAVAIAMHQIDDIDPSDIDGQLQGYVDRVRSRVRGRQPQALLAQGVDQSRLVLVEFDPTFCRLLRKRYPAATVVQGDAYGLRRLLAGLLQQPAAGVVSGLPLFTKPMDVRLELLKAAQEAMHPNAPFVQFTYAVVPPIPAKSKNYTASPSNRVWLNLPPARVWVYRRTA